MACQFIYLSLWKIGIHFPTLSLLRYLLEVFFVNFRGLGDEVDRVDQESHHPLIGGCLPVYLILHGYLSVKEAARLPVVPHHIFSFGGSLNVSQSALLRVQKAGLFLDVSCDFFIGLFQLLLADALYILQFSFDPLPFHRVGRKQVAFYFHLASSLSGHKVDELPVDELTDSFILARNVRTAQQSWKSLQKSAHIQKVLYFI